MTKNEEVLEWIWRQLHKQQLKMPADRLIFEGEHDLAYLYETGFVDTDRYSKRQWILAFQENRQPDGSYSLAHGEWLAKALYRYDGPVGRPFDPMTLREGEWELNDYKKIAKEKILPETTLTYEQFLQGLKALQEQGKITDNKLVITAEKKQKLVALLNQHASPKRRRALNVDKVRRYEELEASPAAAAITAPGTDTQAKKGPGSEFRQDPDTQKQFTGKLSDLLSGGKK